VALSTIGIARDILGSQAPPIIDNAIHYNHIVQYPIQYPHVVLPVPILANIEM
jgi:hypothetical protein